MSHIFSLKGKALKLDTRDDMEKHLKGVDASTITEIHLEGNTIGVDASEALAEWMAGAKNLKVANFADIYTGRLISEIPHSLKAICDALIDKTSLVEVNLSDNAFGGRSVDPMVPFITQNRSFQIFKLNNNGLGPAGGTVIANALRDSARLSKEAGVKSNLRTVICGRNRLEDGSSEAWADAFAEHGTLEEVRMVQNGIWRTGITNLVRGLAKNPNLKHIDLQDNTFTTGGILDGVDEWAKALPSWPELHTLNLSDCILSTEGEVPALLTAIIEGSNPNLKTLIIQNNNLETQTFEALADAMPKALKNLMRLEVQYNDQEEEDEHIERLYDTMKQRGGRLIATDEDEEEDEAEQEAKATAPVVAAALNEKDKEPETVDDSADALADALSKVKISGP